MIKFGKRLRQLRTDALLGQVELAQKLNVGKSIISLWETNQCEPTLSKLIAKFSVLPEFDAVKNI